MDLSKIGQWLQREDDELLYRPKDSLARDEESPLEWEALHPGYASLGQAIAYYDGGLPVCMRILKELARVALPPGTLFEVRLVLGPAAYLGIAGRIVWFSVPPWFAAQQGWKEFEPVSLDDPRVLWQTEEGCYLCARLTTPAAGEDDDVT